MSKANNLANFFHSILVRVMHSIMQLHLKKGRDNFLPTWSNLGLSFHTFKGIEAPKFRAKI